MWPASWCSGHRFWLLIMRFRVRFSVLPWGFFLEGEVPLGDHRLGSLVELSLRPLLVLHISPSTSSGQSNCASWASQTQKSVILQPQPGGGDHEVHKGHVVAMEKKKRPRMGRNHICIDNVSSHISLMMALLKKAETCSLIVISTL
jgi:hypothetical protein